ncbi:MAG: hypothetical protein QOE69_2896 [Thermoleophilaceae bacterium]|nr:hypothetical protein [Thermoleophilaceae bacterium]MEA2408777.1 hypothetical protein [Thermoleophilaceae bacterium]
MTRDDQLQWEARWALPAAISAFLAGLSLLVSAMVFFPKDRKGIERSPDLLLSIDQQSGAYLASALLSALGGLLLCVVFYYLFRAIMARGGGVPRWFVYVVFGAPVLYAASSLAGAFAAIDLADEFVADGIIRGERGADHARGLSGAGPVLVAMATAGTVGLAFLFVMLPLRARRVGLLTPFMGILGAIAGALVVFQLSGISSVIQAFWLGAVGALFLGRWPGGRGPAWSTGEAEPWPSPAQRRGDVPMPANDPPAELDPSLPPEPEPVPERPASRKRRKKR